MRSLLRFLTASRTRHRRATAIAGTGFIARDIGKPVRMVLTDKAFVLAVLAFHQSVPFVVMSGTTPAQNVHVVAAGTRTLNLEYLVSRIMSQRPVLELTSTSDPAVAVPEGVSRYDTEP